MTTKELLDLKSKALINVELACDEHHVHSARCLVGDPDAVAVCLLVDYAIGLRAALAALAVEHGQ